MSAGGDPFISLYVLKLWKDRWYNEVDKFYINYNNHSQVPPEVAGEFCKRVVQDPKVHLIYHPRGIGNGAPITEMVKISQTDLVMLLEDDGFIYKPEPVSKAFGQIESDLCDVVGSPRFSCGNEVGEASAKKYGLSYDGYGDQGPNCWPNFFFCKLEDLKKTDLDFASHTWQAGEYCPKLDHTFREINHGDTFVWSCVQLRALGLRFQNIPQYHADPYEPENKNKKEMNWIKETPYWIHGGSLSTSWNGYLDQAPSVDTEGAKREMETRAAFWKICSDAIDGFDGFKQEYQRKLENLIDTHLDRGRVEDKIRIYSSL